jgi:hypothetical protein
MLGCFVLPKLYICADLRWDLDGLKGVFLSLLQEDFMAYDEQTNLMLVKNYLKHNPIENSNQAQAAIKVVGELPRSRLLSELLDSVKEQGKEFLNPLAEEIEQQLMQPLPELLGEQLLEQNAKPVSVSVTVAVTEDQDRVKGKTFDDGSTEMTLARRLRTRILENLPNGKVPEDTPKGLRGWCEEIDKMIRLDKRDPVDIERIIDWAQSDDFWKANIMSGKKLREKFDRLTLQKQRGDRNRPQPIPQRDSDDDWLIQK